MCDQAFDALTAKTVEALSEISFKEQDHVIYDLEQGTCITFTKLRTEQIHVVHAFMSAGTIFPLHHHKASSETLILEKGDVTVVCDGPECPTMRMRLDLNGEPIHIKENIDHFLHAKEDSWVLATLIPPDKGMLK